MTNEDSIFTGEDEHENVLVPVPEIAHIVKHSVDMVTRTIFIGEEIEEDFGAWFTTVIQYLERLNDRPVTIWLNTSGGDVTSMFVFHDLVRASKLHITIIATGQVCSAGVLMLACGHTRLVTEGCVLMSHRGQGFMGGDLETMEARMKYHKWCEDHWAVLMDRYTPVEVDGNLRDYKYWFALGKKRAEWWVFGGEAIVKEGIADFIYPVRVPS